MKISQKNRMWISRLKGLSEYPEQQIKRDSRKAYKLSTHCRQREGSQSFHIVKRDHKESGIRKISDFTTAIPEARRQ